MSQKSSISVIIPVTRVAALVVALATAFNCIATSLELLIVLVTIVVVHTAIQQIKPFIQPELIDSFDIYIINATTYAKIKS